jgi:hypothetical protein
VVFTGPWLFKRGIPGSSFRERWPKSVHQTIALQVFDWSGTFQYLEQDCNHLKPSMCSSGRKQSCGAAPALEKEIRLGSLHQTEKIVRLLSGGHLVEVLLTWLDDVTPAVHCEVLTSRLILIRLEQHERFSEKKIRAPTQDRTDLESNQKP